MSREAIIESYFAAMRRGSAGAGELFALFTDDAVYTEPFSGDEPAVGIAAIKARFEQGWETPLPDLELDVLELHVDRGEARARWECRSPAFPAPVQGEDRYRFRDGRIVSLEVVLLTDR